MNQFDYYKNERGPFCVENLPPKSGYELYNGHPIQCMATGGRGSKASIYGGQVLETDPLVESAGIDTGFALDKHTMRAPDIAVGNVPDQPGWVPGVPPLAVEYADTGQNEESLANKIELLLSRGTKYIWVVRLIGERLVEVYEPNKPKRIALPGEMLTAPGILQNPIRVEALYDREVAHETALRNLLQHHGYSSVEEIKAESEVRGKAKGKAEGEIKGEIKGKIEGKIELLKRIVIRRFGPLPYWANERIESANMERLESWVEMIFEAQSIDELLS